LIKNGKFINIVAIRCQILITKCFKIEIGWGFAPDPTGGAHDAPPDPSVGWGGGHPLPIPHPLGAEDPRAFGARNSAPRSLRLRRSIWVQLKMFLILSPAPQSETRKNCLIELLCRACRHCVWNALPFDQLVS